MVRPEVAVFVQTCGFSSQQLDRFRAAPRASYALLEETAQGLESGQSERETTTRMMRAFARRRLGGVCTRTASMRRRSRGRRRLPARARLASR
jgi:hypothetical protein